MRKFSATTVGGLLLCLMSVPGWADDDEPLGDISMQVVDAPDAGEQDYVEEIDLPTAASSNAAENAAFGLETANEARDRARENGSAFGQSVAQEARERARDAANAGNASNGQGKGPPDDLPVQVPNP